MSGPEFFQTLMGARFYEGTMPRVAEQLERLNDNLEALFDLLWTRHEHELDAPVEIPSDATDGRG